MLSKSNRIAFVLCWSALLLVTMTDSEIWAQTGSDQPKLRRVKRPVFPPKNSGGIFFQDLFAEALVGPRPQKLAPGQKPVLPSNMVAGTDSTSPTETPKTGFAWSEVISSSSIEDEVKSLQQSLTADITTPSKFKADYAKAHQSFSILSMLFAVVREYDSDVRWKKHAGPAQASFEKAAANSRVGTIQAYESCKRRAADLMDMVRGGNFAGTDKPTETIDWSMVVGHSPIMKQLESSYGKLKPLVSNKKEFQSNVSEVMRHAELIAVMSRVVQLENMDYAEEDGYVEYAKAMYAAATKVSAGCRTDDFDSVSDGVNLIGQSCTNCHDDWR